MSRIPYMDPDSIDDPEIQEFFAEAKRVGTPRPEVHAVRAHQPEILRAFMYMWKRAFKGGVLDFELKELVRVRIASTLDCAY